MNPRDGGAWWAAIYGVAQSRTRLKQLSSSSGKPDKMKQCSKKLKTECTRKGEMDWEMDYISQVTRRVQEVTLHLESCLESSALLGKHLCISYAPLTCTNTYKFHKSKN